VICLMISENPREGVLIGRLWKRAKMAQQKHDFRVFTAGRSAVTTEAMPEPRQ